MEAKMPPVLIGPRCNRRVTCDLSPSNDRSESSLAVNPLDPFNMVGASKRFTNPATYAFSLAAYATFDGGLSWTEAAPLTLLPGWAGTSDPVVSWDNTGAAYLVALPFGPGAATPVVGIAVYRSADGGRTWGPPNLIHASPGDDKQTTAADTNPASPFYGNVYAAWDDGSTLRFARTTDHGVTWRGAGAQPVGTSLANDSFAPALAVAPDGTVYIVWSDGELSGSAIKFVKSTDGGGSFSAPATVATGITKLTAAAGLPQPGSFPELPGGHFRVLTIAAVCTGHGGHLVAAWADYREGRSRVYYRHSANGGASWLGPASGQPLLSGPVAPAADQHDFHPQLAAAPAGEIGCSFYEFGPKGGGEFPPQLIDVVLAVSTDNGASFPNRATVTDQAWDPTVDAPLSHGDPTTTFIGDYFGLTASRLGFFPFWTDTRTGVQEIFTARVAVNPADLYIRDAAADIGDVPSPGNHWEAPDLIVRRQPDGDTTFVDEDLLRDGVTDHYVYGRISNRGPNTANNVRLAVTVGNYPSLLALPGAEFRYPQDWYPGDWTTPAVRANHLFLGESAPTTLASGATKVVGPIVWPAAQIPPHTTWHPCLLAEARADNDDAAGGGNGCDVPADPNPCAYGSYFWGNNNVCQRNLSYAPVPPATALLIELPFIVGSVWSSARFLEVIVDKGPELARTPMTLRLEEVIDLPEGPRPSPCAPGELVLVEGGRVVVRVGDCQAGELLAAPGTVWRATCPEPAGASAEPETYHGAEKAGEQWQLREPRAAVGFVVLPGELRRMVLSFATPTTLKHGTRTLVQIFQRNDKQIVTGSVQLQVDIAGDSNARRPARARRTRSR
jgi:hypothetical protein